RSAAPTSSATSTRASTRLRSPSFRSGSTRARRRATWPRSDSTGETRDMPVIQSVTGKIKPEKLGKTLMHEHVLVGYSGWDADWVRPGPSKREMRKIAADKIAEMKDEGIKTMIDPCPSDLGRDIEFIAEVAQKAKFNIVAATGLYHE